jgi:hypothetical protein
MEIVTLITAAADVEAARAAAIGEADFGCQLSASGKPPATHYMSSGILSNADTIDALDGLADIYWLDADDALIEAGLKVVRDESSDAV